MKLSRLSLCQETSALPSSRDPSPATRKVLTERNSNQNLAALLGSSRYVKRTETKESSRPGCTVCLNAEANAVLMDCGHGAICFECGLKLLETTCECHLCRRPVIQVLKVDVGVVGDGLLRVLESADLHNITKYQQQLTPRPQAEANSLHTPNI